MVRARGRAPPRVPYGDGAGGGATGTLCCVHGRHRCAPNCANVAHCLDGVAGGVDAMAEVWRACSEAVGDEGDGVVAAAGGGRQAG